MKKDILRLVFHSACILDGIAILILAIIGLLNHI